MKKYNCNYIEDFFPHIGNFKNFIKFQYNEILNIFDINLELLFKYFSSQIIDLNHFNKANIKYYNEYGHIKPLNIKHDEVQVDAFGKLPFYDGEHFKIDITKSEITKNKSMDINLPSLFIPSNLNYKFIISLCQTCLEYNYLKLLPYDEFYKIYYKYDNNRILYSKDNIFIKQCIKYAIYQYIDYRVIYSNILNLLREYKNGKEISEVEINTTLSWNNDRYNSKVNEEIFIIQLYMEKCKDQKEILMFADKINKEAYDLEHEYIMNNPSQFNLRNNSIIFNYSIDNLKLIDTDDNVLSMYYNLIVQGQPNNNYNVNLNNIINNNTLFQPFFNINNNLNNNYNPNYNNPNNNSRIDSINNSVPINENNILYYNHNNSLKIDEDNSYRINKEIKEDHTTTTTTANNNNNNNNSNNKYNYY